jgi:hypothetical protein
MDMEVVIFEDDSTLLELLTDCLNDAGHHVIADACSPEEADELVDKIIAGEVEADVAVTDGNLRIGNREKCGDARKIVAGLGQAARKPHVVGFATDSLLEQGIPVDTDLTKTSRVSGVVEFINQLSTERLLST